MRETVAHFHASKYTVSKRQHCFILHLGDGRQRVWHRIGEPCWVTTGATWCQWRGGRISGDIFYMTGRSWCRLTGHWMPQSTTQNTWPVTCCRTGMLWATRELLTSFCWTTAHPTQRDWVRSDWFQPRRQVLFAADFGLMVSRLGYGIHDSINVTKMLPCPTKAPDFKNIECLKSSEAPIEMEYYNHWHKWRHESLLARGVAYHGHVLALAMGALCEA